MVTEASAKAAKLRGYFAETFLKQSYQARHTHLQLQQIRIGGIAKLADSG